MEEEDSEALKRTRSAKVRHRQYLPIRLCTPRSTGVVAVLSPPASLTARLRRQIERGAHIGLTRELNLLTNAMHICVACSAKCNQVRLCIVARLATQFFVMNFQIRYCAATLTPPAVSA